MSGSTSWSQPFSPDLKAEVIAESVVAHPNMSLIERRCVAAAEVEALLDSLPESPQLTRP